MSQARPTKGRTAVRRVRIMISSRNTDPFPGAGGAPLTEGRRRIKAMLEAERLFDQPLFEVWINEDAPAPATQDSWDACMKQVDACDILLVLANGHAGWTVGAGDIGICHGELMRGRHAAPGKVHIIQLGDEAARAAFTSGPDVRFQADIRRSNVFIATATTVAELETEVRQTVLHAVAELIGRGAKETRGAQFHLGEALEWSKLDYRSRADRIETTLGRAIVENGGSEVGGRFYTRRIDDEEVFLCVHAVPGAMTISAAREMVGRPFLRDHERLDDMGAAVGPVHLIGCNRTATETQAASLLGFPDAAIVSAPFGIWVADEVQKIQFVLLENCRDEALTRLALQRFMSWLDQSGEGAVMAARAAARRRIVEAVQAER